MFLAIIIESDLVDRIFLHKRRLKSDVENIVVWTNKQIATNTDWDSS